MDAILKRLLLGGIVIAASVAILVCGNWPQRGKIEYVGGAEDTPKKIIECDVYVTWKNYDAVHYERATYYVDGECVGVGEAGWKAVLQRLRGCAKGSRVLVYPLYPYGNMAPSSRYTYFPFHYFEQPDKVVRERELVLIYSNYDNNGDLVNPGREALP
jgi:hypothetical protein